VNHQTINVALRTSVWLGALAWWVYLRKPAATSLLQVRPGIATIAGAGLAVAGVILYVWDARALAGAVPRALAPPAVSLSRGPYRFLRNPLYVAAGAVFLGASTLYAPWHPRDLIAVGLIAILVHMLVVRREEPATRRRLGSAYDKYCAEVPRWIPRFSHLHSAQPGGSSR